MKNNVIAFSAASVLVISLIVIGTSKTSTVSALTATTTTSAPTTTTTSATTSSTTSTTDASSTSPTPPAQTLVPAQTQAQAQPGSSKPTLKLVHVVGSKYIDYFTDGTKTYSFPGDPKVDGNLNKPNAPIPTHGNLKWVSTSGMDAYDTPSSDLEPGDYAQESDGSYVSNVPAYTYTDATSSVPVAAHVAYSKTDPTLASSAAPALTQTSATTASTSPATSDSTIVQPAATSSSGSATTSTAQ